MIYSRDFYAPLDQLWPVIIEVTGVAIVCAAIILFGLLFLATIVDRPKRQQPDERINAKRGTTQ